MNSKSNLKVSMVFLAALSITTAAQAQSFSSMADKVKKEITKTKSQKKIVENRTSREAKAASHKKGSGSAPELGAPSKKLTSMTKCSAVKPSNIIVGNLGDYTFQQGFSSEKRSGFINRKTASLSGDCILPSLQSRQVAYMEVDTKAFAAMGGSNDWEMQCIKSANPSAGAVGEKEGRAEYAYHVKFLTGKHMMLHCGNSENISECAEGSNSKRGSAWKKKLKKNGKTMLSVHANTSTLAPAQGEKLYCQYYNKKSRTSLFGFEYLRLQN